MSRKKGSIPWNKGKKLGFIPKGAFKKGQTPWNKGKPPSEETKRKLSEINKGKKQSEETRKKKSEALKGRVFSEEHRRKIGDAQKGEKSHTFGKHPSEETRKKLSESRKGEKNPFWKGGTTPLTKQIRGCFKYRQWRSDIFTKDDFTCVICGKRGCYLEADHYPKRFSDIFHDNKIKTLEEALACEEFWNINNGRTLCVNCHNKTKNGRNKKGGKQE